MDTSRPLLRNGFTLIELAMVVALLALLATLAVSKYAGLRDSSARKVSAVNQRSVSESVGTYLAFNGGRGLDYLDALVPRGAASVPGGTFDYGGGKLYAGPAVATPRNRGLADGLRAVLAVYGLTAAEADALRRDLGLVHVLRHAVNSADLDATGSDGSLPPSWADPLRAETSACIVATPTNDFAVAAIDPRFESGALIYQAMGQHLPITRRQADGQNIADADVLSAIDASGGRLVAFGLGQRASIVGNSRGGLEVCPYSEAVAPDRYRNYILLVRLVHTSGTACRAEFAGAIDPEGRAADAARQDLSGL